jgi:hypothetical protein
MADDTMKVHIEGQEYALDDFSLGELEWLEDELGTLDDDAISSMKGAVRLVTIVRRREDPSYTVEQARLIKMSALSPPVPDKPKRPTRAAKAAASTPDVSGVDSSLAA